MKNIKKITAPFRIKYRKARVLFGLSILAVTSVIANPVLAKTPPERPAWLTTKFKVIHADPKGLGRSIGKIDPYRDYRIEVYLGRVGGTYKNSGFSAPLLPTKTIDGQRFYVVYLFDWKDDKVLGRTAAPDENFPKGLMMFDTSEIYDTVRKNNKDRASLTPRGYAVLGHELFHAIQNGYANKQKYFLGTWITEGSAQAVGLDMFFKYAPPDAVKLITPKDKYFVPTKRWGGRNYAAALRTIHKKRPGKLNKTEREKMESNGYDTASLWRYIDEYIRTSGNPTLSPPARTGNYANYSYLNEFFSLELPTGGTDEEKELEWLDQNLKAHLKLSLSVIYPLHITDLAHYFPGRAPEKSKDPHLYDYYTALYTAPKSLELWKAALFCPGGVNEEEVCPSEVVCKKASLSESKRSDEVNLSFKKVSAACLEVTFTGTAPAPDIHIYLDTQDQKMIDSIQYIGVQKHFPNSSKQIVLLKAVTKPEKPADHSSTIPKNFTDAPVTQWKFVQVPFHEKSRTSTFIISNVADKVSDTLDDATVSFLVKYPVSKGEKRMSK